MAEVKFRNYESNDDSSLHSLYLAAIQSVYPNFNDGAWLNDLRSVNSTYIEAGGGFVVGEYNESIIAMAGIKRISEPVGEGVRIAVTPKLYGLGIGQRLLETMEVKARYLGVSRLIIGTTLAQTATRHLYEKNGFTLFNRACGAHSTGAILGTIYYEKNLENPTDVISIEDFWAVHNRAGASQIYSKLYRDVLKDRISSLQVLAEDEDNGIKSPRLVGDIQATISQICRMGGRLVSVHVLNRIKQKLEEEQYKAHTLELDYDHNLPSRP